jgi:hypothetical protein
MWCGVAVQPKYWVVVRTRLECKKMGIAGWAGSELNRGWLRGGRLGAGRVHCSALALVQVSHRSASMHLPCGHDIWRTSHPRPSPVPFNAPSSSLYTPPLSLSINISLPRLQISRYTTHSLLKPRSTAVALVCLLVSRIEGPKSTYSRALLYPV